MTRRRARIIGPGRAGGALALVLAQVGWRVLPSLRRGDDLAAAAGGVDLLVLAVPDGALGEVAAAVEVVEATVVLHLAGSLGLDVLAPHPRRAALHPLVSLPSASVGAERLIAGAWFAVAGDPMATDIVNDLGGRAVPIADEQRAAYHAAAVIASNHLVALMGQVERVAESVGVPSKAMWALAQGALENVQRLGPAAALTGPVQRGDWATVRRHVAALGPNERPAYLAMARAAAALVGRKIPDDLA
jgi:predicted short-subunit dehydrogenase-like oxidoreductase (DUF2520 family)